MQIDEIIACVDCLEPNQYEQEVKLSWLSELDGKIMEELIKTHENPPELQQCPPYEEGGCQLIAGEPYGKDLYSYYLQAMIALNNMEGNKYNQMMIAFNNAYKEFSNWYNRTHRSISRGRLKF